MSSKVPSTRRAQPPTTAPTMISAFGLDEDAGDAVVVTDAVAVMVEVALANSSLFPMKACCMVAASGLILE